MKLHITPYLFFDGRCAEAISFYQNAIGAEVVFMMQYKDAPEGLPSEMGKPELRERVMHATFKIGDSEIMTADAPPGNHKGHGGFSLSITVATEAQAKQIFTAMSDDGKVLMPLSPTFFSSCFGTLEDKFGVEWMVYVEGQTQS